MFEAKERKTTIIQCAATLQEKQYIADTAAALGMSTSDLIRNALREYIAQHK